MLLHDGFFFVVAQETISNTHNYYHCGKHLVMNVFKYKLMWINKVIDIR